MIHVFQILLVSISWNQTLPIPKSLFLSLSHCCPSTQVIWQNRTSTVALICCHCAVYATQASSGGHLNPAFSIAMAVSGHMHWMKALLYVLAQVIASDTHLTSDDSNVSWQSLCQTFSADSAKWSVKCNRQVCIFDYVRNEMIYDSYRELCALMRTG